MGKTRNFNTSNRDDRYPDFSLKKAFKILLPEITLSTDEVINKLNNKIGKSKKLLALQNAKSKTGRSCK